MKSRSALQFVLIIGIANFFADFTYEGARAIVGPFLGSLGASAAIVGFVAGLGELAGYGFWSITRILRRQNAPILGDSLSRLCDQHAGRPGSGTGWQLAYCGRAGRRRAHRSRD